MNCIQEHLKQHKTMSIPMLTNICDISNITIWSLLLVEDTLIAITEHGLHMSKGHVQPKVA